jgi:MFS family permease
MSSRIPTAVAEESRIALRKIYFLLGLGVMAWAPRFPELQDQLNLSASRFGFLLSFSSAGSIIAFSLMGHLVHAFGAKPVLYISGVFTYSAMVAVTLSNSPLVFQFTLILFSASVVGYNVALNSQSILIQNSLDRPVLGQFHGSWSAGAFLTSGFSGIVAPLISLQLHILTLALILLPLAAYQTSKLIDVKFDPAADDERPAKQSIPPIWKAPKLQWILSIGMTCGVLIEFTGADWITIYTHENLGVPTGPDAIPITVFMFAIIVGRLNTDRLAQAIGMDNLVRISGYVGFIGGAIAVAGSHVMKDIGVWQALLVATFGYFLAGLGTACMTPAFFSAGSRIKESPAAVTLSRMAMLNHVFVWNFKLLIAALAGAFGMQVALLIPALAILAVVVLAKYVKPETEVRT